jgi:hypothetical protein
VDLSDVLQTTKQVGEKRVLGFNFSGELDVNDTVTEILAVSISPYGDVAQVSALTEDQRAIFGQMARVRFSGGTNGERYLIVCQVRCSDGQELFCPIILIVSNSQTPG